MDPLNALFWNLVSGWKNLKRNPNLHTLRIDDAFDLLTSHNNNNNNNDNGGQHACVRAAEDIELIRVTWAKYSAPLPLR